MAIRDINDDGAICSENSLSKKVALSDFSIQNRGGKGMICYKPTLVSGKVTDGALINNNDNLLSLTKDERLVAFRKKFNM